MSKCGVFEKANCRLFLQVVIAEAPEPAFTQIKGVSGE